MKTVILASDPYTSQSYEQGIEVALNLAEAGIEVQVVAASDFLRAYEGIKPDCVILKKLNQLELFDIPVISRVDDCCIFEPDAGVMSF